MQTPTCKLYSEVPPLLKPFLPFPLRKPIYSCPYKLTRKHLTLASSASTVDIELVKNKQGIYAPKRSQVVVLWDLDNKPPRGPPYPAAMYLKKLASSLGDVIEISAYANRHAFVHLPQWVLQERRGRRELDFLERKGMVSPPPGSYTCGMCGRKCGTHLELKKHFKQLHERERQKKVNRMKSLRGKKRRRFKERFISGNDRYNEEARRLVTPRVGYGLAGELRRAGVYVKTVEDKPQAADWAVKRQIEHSMSRGVDWLVLVSDDSDFREILRRAREARLGTVVVGDRDGALGRHADYWVPWEGVESGKVTEKDLVRESVFDEFVVVGNGFDGVRVSSFSQGEWEEEEEEEEEEEYCFEWSDEDEEFGMEDGGIWM